MAACSDPPPPTAEPATTFNISRADMWRENPRDICRQADRDFMLKLMERVDQALPLDAKSTASFDRFLVMNSFDGKGKEAVLWFTARHEGRDNATMFAVAPFDPDGCKVGPMKASVGTDLHRDAGRQGFEIR